MSDNFSWDEMEDAFGEVEQQFKAGDDRPPEAIASGIPKWALTPYLDMLETWEQESTEHDVIPKSEAAEKFKTTFVEPLEKGRVSVSYDGVPSRHPSEMEGQLSFEMSPQASFTLWMALKVACGLLEKAGPMAMAAAGLNPNLEDMMDMLRLSGALGQAILLVTSDEVATSSLDAR